MLVVSICCPSLKGNEGAGKSPSVPLYERGKNLTPPFRKGGRFCCHVGKFPPLKRGGRGDFEVGITVVLFDNTPYGGVTTLRVGYESHLGVGVDSLLRIIYEG